MGLRNFPADEIQPNLVIRAPHDLAFAPHAAVMGHIQNELVRKADRVAADQFGARLWNVAEVTLVGRLAGPGINPARLIYRSTIGFSSIDRHGDISRLRCEGRRGLHADERRVASL